MALEVSIADGEADVPSTDRDSVVLIKEIRIGGTLLDRTVTAETGVGVTRAEASISGRGSRKG